MSYKYKSMSQIKAKNYLEKGRETEDWSLDGYVEVKGRGEDYPQEQIEKLRTELLKIKAQFPEKINKWDKSGGQFEAIGSEIVHRILPHDPHIFADTGFWVWLAVTQLSDIVEWRHGSDIKFAELANYGIGSGKRIENLFLRMWLRADLVVDYEAEEPYYLSKLGDQDLWRSHIIRQGYSNVRALAKALVIYQCIEEGKRLTNDSNGIRALAKRLKRLRANVMFEFLDINQLNHIIKEQSTGLAIIEVKENA